MEFEYFYNGIKYINIISILILGCTKRAFTEFLGGSSKKDMFDIRGIKCIEMHLQ